MNTSNEFIRLEDLPVERRRKAEKYIRIAQRGKRSTGWAFAFALLLGPIGMFYASIWWALGFIALHVIAFFFSFGLLNIFLWPIGCIVAIESVKDYNRNIIKKRQILMNSGIRFVN